MQVVLRQDLDALLPSLAALSPSLRCLVVRRHGWTADRLARLAPLRWAPRGLWRGAFALLEPGVCAQCRLMPACLRASTNLPNPSGTATLSSGAAAATALLPINRRIAADLHDARRGLCCVASAQGPDPP